jgi:hypothetical protein
MTTDKSYFTEEDLKKVDDLKKNGGTALPISHR